MLSSIDQRVIRSRCSRADSTRGHMAQSMSKRFQLCVRGSEGLGTTVGGHVPGIAPQLPNAKMTAKRAESLGSLLTESYKGEREEGAEERPRASRKLFGEHIFGLWCKMEVGSGQPRAKNF